MDKQTIRPSTALYGIGCNAFGQCGGGDSGPSDHSTTMVPLTTLVSTTNSTILGISGCWELSLAWTCSLELWMWGHLDSFGLSSQDGSSSSHCCLDLRACFGLSVAPKFILPVMAGRHAFIRGNHGPKEYSPNTLWILTDALELIRAICQPNHNSGEWARETIASDIVQVCATSTHILALHKGGLRVMEMTTSTLDAPTQWLVNTSGVPWTHIAAGHTHGLALNTHGDVFSWGGHGLLGQLGQGPISSTQASKEPVLIDGLEGMGVGKIAAGAFHSVAWVPKDQVMYAFGSNAHGQLGGMAKSDDGMTNVDIDEDIIPKGGIKFLGAGDAYTVLSDGNRIFTLGMLCPTTISGDDDDENSSTSVNIKKCGKISESLLPEKGPGQIIDVFAAPWHCLILTRTTHPD